MVQYTNKEEKYNRFVRKIQDSVKRLLTVEELANLREYFTAAVNPDTDSAERYQLHVRYVKENLLDQRQPRQIFTNYKAPSTNVEDYDYAFDEFGQ